MFGWDSDKVYISVILHSHKAHTDASSRRWGGTLVSSSEIFKSSEEFDDQDVEQHINKKEALVFYRSLYNFLPPHEELVKNKR